MCPNLDLTNLFSINDSITESNEKVKDNNLLSYLAWSTSPRFDYSLCLNLMEQRTAPEDIPTLSIRPHETSVFNRRFKTLKNNNRFYMLAVKETPSVKSLETFSYIDPCFSTLWPLKLYLIDHPETAKEFRGMLPFGSEVKRYWNSVSNPECRINGSPSFRDHVTLKDWTNWQSDLTGLTPLAINNILYLKGKKIQSSPVDVDTE